MLTSFHAFFARVLLAVLLSGGAGVASAGPLYHVSLDTDAWSGSGFLSFTLTGLDKAPPVTATLSNFSGSFGNASFTLGQVSGDLGAGVTLTQGPSFNELLQAIDFGGAFSFDVMFDVPAGLLDGSHFGVALVNAAQTAYADGTEGDIVSIGLMPGAADLLMADARYATVSAVPEPGSVAMVGLALLLAGWSRARSVRRR